MFGNYQCGSYSQGTEGKHKKLLSTYSLSDGTEIKEMKCENYRDGHTEYL